MSEITLQIDGKEIKTEEGVTLLEAAREAGIHIPTLCYSEDLSTYGACRICSVEITRGKRTRIVASCCYPAQDGLVVTTNSPRVIKIRKMLIELMLAYAPGAKVLQDLAAEYGVEGTRFKAEPNLCILCGLCMRYCAEVKRANAIGFVGRGTTRQIAFVPEIALGTCATCKECFSLCPTAKLPRETDGVCLQDLTVDDFLAKHSG